MRALRSVKARRGTRHWDWGDDFDPALAKKDMDPTKVFDLEAEQEAFSNEVLPVVTNVYETFGEGTAESLGVAFNLRDENVARDILERDNRLRGTVDTTWEAIQDAIIDGEAAGEGIDGIAKRIGGVFDQAKGYRARVIARTETIGASNAASLQAADASGVVGKKTWLAASDPRTRPSHVSADGQTVDVKKAFNVGTSKMQHPGDPAGGARETVNCRCSMIFERLPDAEVPADEFEEELPPELALPEGVTRTGVDVNARMPKGLSKDDQAKWFEEKWGKVVTRETDRTAVPDSLGRYPQKWVEKDRVMGYQKLAKGTHEETLRFLDEAFSAAPAVADRIPYVGTLNFLKETRGPDGLRLLYKISRGTKGVARRRTMYGTPSSAIKDLAESSLQQKAAGWWSTGDARHVLAHEFGHHVHYTVEEALGSFGGDKSLLVDEILQPAFEEASGRSGAILSRAGGADSNAAWVAENLSKYGASDAYEVSAEAWAEYVLMGDEARPLAKAIGRRMEEALANVETP